MFDLFREINQTLQTNRTRTTLTGIAVAWGIFMLIVLLGATRGVINSFEKNSTTSDRLTIHPGVTSKAYGGLPPGRSIRLEVSDIEHLSNDIPDKVRAAIGMKTVSTVNLVGPKDNLRCDIEGVFPEYQNYRRLDMICGRFISAHDLNEKRKVLVLPARTARLLFGDEESAIGKYVTGMNLTWKVVGVFDDQYTSSDAYTAFTTGTMLSGNSNRVWNVTVLMKNVTDELEATALEDEIYKVLGRNHRFDPTDRNAVWVFNNFTSYLKNLEAMSILRIAMWVIGLCTLLTGIVGVGNIMFVSVRERTHEIGIRRAIGARPRQIVLQIVTEAVVITALFGYIGIVLGMVATQILDKLYGQTEVLTNPTVSLSIAVEVTVVLIIAGALAGLFPALRALKIKPVEALRDE